MIITARAFSHAGFRSGTHINFRFHGDKTFALETAGGLPTVRAAQADSSMAKQEFTILNKLGIHARPAAQFVKTANRFHSDVFVEKDGEEVDGKSIMGLMMLAAGHGSVIAVSADGPDAEQALAALGDLIARKFEEE